MFHPQNFDFDGFTPFFYSTYFYYANYQEDIEKLQPEIAEDDMKNVLLWQQLTKKKIGVKTIYQALYQSDFDLTNASKNEFIQQLHREQKRDLLKYIAYVHKASLLNTYHSDPWEKNDESDVQLRSASIQEIQQILEKENNPFLKRRYAFLAMRLAFYNSQHDLIEHLWKKYISQTEKDIVYYWAMYYWNVGTPDSQDRDNRFYEIFYHASGKRQVIRSNYLYGEAKIEGKEVTNPLYEKEFLFYKSIRNTSRTLEEIKLLQKKYGNTMELDFLLLREVNKLEDWLVSPKIILDQPAIYNMDSCCYSEVANILYPMDVQYAKEVLQFIKGNNPKNNYVWDLSEGYLNYLLGNFGTSKVQIQRALKKYKHKKKQKLLNQILILNRVALRDPSIRLNDFSMDEFDLQNKFVLALAKQFEKNKQIVEAMVVYSWIESVLGYEEYYNWMVWKGERPINNYWGDFFTEYKDYIDYISGPKEIERLIQLTKKHMDHPNFKILKRDLPFLYDLLGTKHLRRGHYKTAQINFKKAGTNYYNDDENPFNYYLSANPFYADINSYHRKTKGDTLSYTKEQIMKKLLFHLEAVKTSKKKSYHYNIIANCFFNMSYHGNSWMMRRRAWSQEKFHNGMIDEKEYHQANLAKNYYYKAYLNSHQSDSSAYYLAMAGKCEDLRQKDVYDDYFDRTRYNSYYKKIKLKYEDWGEIFLGGCYAYDQAN
ncbi:MAG: hypothetical protein R2799_08375 [Crocinitomicaceae bacterium]